MTVYVVLKNGKVDAVFSSEAAAITHKKNLGKKWSIAEILPMPLLDL